MAETNIKTPGRVEDVRRPRGSVPADRLAEVSRDWEREIGSDPRDPVPPGEDVRTATADVLVPLDVTVTGPTEYESTSYTFVAAGDRLPARAEVVPADASPAYRAKVQKAR